MCLWQVQKTAAVAQVLAFDANAFFRQPVHHFVEAGNLQVRERLVGFVRLGEMGHRALLSSNDFSEQICSMSESASVQRTP